MMQVQVVVAAGGRESADSLTISGFKPAEHDAIPAPRAEQLLIALRGAPPYDNTKPTYRSRLRFAYPLIGLAETKALRHSDKLVTLRDGVFEQYRVLGETSRVVIASKRE